MWFTNLNVCTFSKNGVYIKKYTLKSSIATRPLCRFYLINPGRNSSVTSTVRKLIDINEVKEVYVTEGPHGFLVKAAPSNTINSRKITTNIARQFGGQVNVITSYAKYRK